MATSTDTRHGRSAPSPRRGQRSIVYSVLIGIASLGVLLQGVWAGAFMREGQEYGGPWLEVHDAGARITFVLAGLALLASIIWLRGRIGVIVGTAVFFGLVYLESWLGGEIGRHASYQSVHFPLAMALLALAVWLPLTHRRGGARDVR